MVVLLGLWRWGDLDLASTSERFEDVAEEVGARDVLVCEVPGTRLASAFAEEDDPSVVSSGEDVREFEVGAVEPVDVWRDVEVVEQPRELGDTHADEVSG
jgi:hypothetical protein